MIYRALTGLAGAGLRAAAPLAGENQRERLALDPVPAIPGGIWVHGASVGELNSARPVIAALAAERPVLVTANTVTGRGVAQGWGLPARLAPLDVPGAVARFLDAARPALMVTVENEIWPNRAAEARRRGIPQAVIGARMSERSARGWRRARGLVGPVLAGLDLLSAQDAGTEARLVALGLPQPAIAPRLNLKLLGPAAVVPPPEGPGRGRVWLAASTHPGEDGPVLAAHAALSREFPGLRLILAPRHPRRADEVAALIAAQGFAVVRLGDRPLAAAGTPPVLLVDRLGVMAEAYAAAGICLTGGSLADHGGHTPWEPAAHGCALLHGPHVANFAADYVALDAAGAAEPVDAATLAGRLAGILQDDARRRAMGAAARAALDAAAPDPEPLVAALLALARPGAGADIGWPDGGIGMIRYALRCDQGHGFDGWFRSAEGFDAMCAAGQVACSVCGSTAVAKAPMAPAVPARDEPTRDEGDAPGPLTRPGSPAEAMIAALRRHVEANSDYVGPDFATQARAMHEGEIPERPIHGETALDDARKLVEDGIPVAPLPFRPRRKLS